MVKEYASKSYWEERFQSEDKFEWLQTFETTEMHLNALLEEQNGGQRDISILVIGCGNSSLSVDLYNAGWKNITSVDFSEVVIEKMKNQHSDKPEMKWIVSDVRDMNMIPNDRYSLSSIRSC
jgi:2-polyprenyl-3-methyl-5-hydroxy-6-metoxy-1,4-benzoquinol methylase